MTTRWLLIFLLFVMVPPVRAASRIETYPRPVEIPASPDYSLQIRTPGGDWVAVDNYAVEVDMHDPRRASAAWFDFTGEVEISITSEHSVIRSAVVRPLATGIQPEISGKKLTFTLREPRNLSIEINGNRFRNLHLFAGPIQPERPREDDPTVMYFGPGVHDLGKKLIIPSGKTVYLAGGAVLKSTLVCDHAENIRIYGRGAIYQSTRGIEITHSQNIRVDGITVINPQHYTIYGGQSQGITIRNLKSFSSRGWSDGIDLMSCADVLVEGVFMRNSDDCIAIYGHRWKFSGDTRNITVRDSILWADVAHPIMVGTHGNPAQPETIENLTFQNIDILEHDEPQIDYQGCIAINVSDENLVKKVLIQDIRIEDFQQGQLFNFRVAYNKKYATAPGRGIQDVRVKNVTYQGSHAGISILSGYDGTRQIRDVIFENLRLNGTLIQSADAARFYIGSHVENVDFVTPKPTP